ncbi:hypothetical protein [Sphingomonas sp.]|uniref:hypothetical protein n=1 Tax=Sphingomonas sp. TaxID=28214 RepID=UPI003F715F8C
MSVTRIVCLDDGRSILETFDFRSEFSFDDFAVWISDCLEIRPEGVALGDDMQPFSFFWDGELFEAAWTDDNGCFIRAPNGGWDKLKAMQSALAG